MHVTNKRDSAVRPRRVDKPWGHEIIWAENPDYLGKRLHVEAGEALSLQFHEAKDETIHLVSGLLPFWAGDSVEDLREIELRQGQSFHVRPGLIHRMQAVTSCVILEASTSHLDDIVRIEDRYGRVQPSRKAG